VDAGERDAALAAVGATRTLADWIGSRPVPRLFERTAVARDLAALLDGWRDLPPGWCAVTLDGDLADGRGLVVVRGRADDSVGEAARQHARRRELAEIVATLEAEQRDAGEMAAQALVAASEARRRQDEASGARAEAVRRVVVARSAREHATEALERARGRERALTTELAAARTAAPAAASVAPSSVDAELAELAARLDDARERRDRLAGGRDRRRAAWQAAQSAADATDTGSGVTQGRALLVARQEQEAARLAADRASLAELGRERDAANEAVEAARAEVERATAERAAADAERDRLRTDLLERERDRGGAVSQLVEQEREAQLAALEAQRLDDELVAIGRERDLAIESLPAPAADPEPGSDGEGRPDDLTPADIDVLEAELTRVRRTLSQIGSVNPFAIDEHRELAGRLETLAGQDADLSGAAASTEQLISRLDAEIAEQFNAAFVAIGAKFDEFCRLLFAGGSASLQMSDGDGDGAGGIEIAVRPPGKRLQRLAMLSGGERALTGVALLFAMLSVNPVPFCILDEVDAALDEANIGRFADALRLLAQTIDFVVITHNRATIETADTIYGVTMTDAAVSRLLSLRLADLPVEVAAG
jgi:chromosome segregation protein